LSLIDLWLHIIFQAEIADVEGTGFVDLEEIESTISNRDTLIRAEASE
jgi:hypothetical protein